MGNCRKMSRVGLLLFVFVAAASAYSSGYSSGYASGSASSFASGAPAPAPPPAPTPASSSTVQHYVQATVKLAGISAAQFNAAAQTAFKEVVATTVSICGANGASACTKSDVVIVSFTDGRRAGVSVKFKVNTVSAAKATAGATTLNTYLATPATFVNALKAKGGNLASVTGVTVVSAPAAGSSTKKVAGVGNMAVLSVLSVVSACVAWSRQ